MKNQLLPLVGKSLKDFTILQGHLVFRHSTQGVKLAILGFFLEKLDAVTYTQEHGYTKREDALILTNGKEFYSLEGRLVLPISLSPKVNFNLKPKSKVVRKKISA